MKIQSILFNQQMFKSQVLYSQQDIFFYKNDYVFHIIEFHHSYISECLTLFTQGIYYHMLLKLYRKGWVVWGGFFPIIISLPICVEVEQVSVNLRIIDSVYIYFVPHKIVIMGITYCTICHGIEQNNLQHSSLMLGTNNNCQDASLI